MTNPSALKCSSSKKQILLYFYFIDVCITIIVNFSSERIVHCANQTNIETMINVCGIKERLVLFDVTYRVALVGLYLVTMEMTTRFIDNALKYL